MAAGGRDLILRLWPIPQSPTPVPEWFLVLSETIAGMRVGVRGQQEVVPEWEFETAIQELPTRDKTDVYVRLAQWFLADPSNRGMPPF